MKPLTIMFFIAAAGLLAVVTGVPRSHFISAVGRAGAGGEAFYAELQGSVLRDVEKRAQYVVVAVRNITARIESDLESKRQADDTMTRR